MPTVIIDGSEGEGGGQMLRTSLSLSAIYGLPFEMVNIRASRPKPGLKPQHLMCVRAVAEICGADVEGDEAESMRFEFRPGGIMIPSSVTSIGYGAFNGCTGLRDVYFEGKPLIAIKDLADEKVRDNCYFHIRRSR